MRQYQPQVVVTYDENGFYGHPDHIQANRITLAAMADCGIPQKLYYTAVARSMLQSFSQTLRDSGIELPEEVQENPEFGTPDELITTVVDCTAVAGRKFASLAAHASQSDNIFFLKMGEELFGTIMGKESFVRVHDTTQAPVPEDDLFAGVR
jgi:LmbE family N-acetylglucosaminyl deacetylase